MAPPSELRPYQLRAVEQLRARWRERPLLCLATGAGKTVIAQAVIQGALTKGKRVLVVAHTRQIIEQTARRFDCPMVMAEHRGEGPLLVASIQTIARRGAPPHDLLIVDEAHHSAARTYRDLVQAAPVVIGLTATPQRLDGKGLGDVGFGCIIEPVTVRDLIRDGYLSEPLCYAKPFDASKLRIAHGEFTTESAEESVRYLHGEIAEHWLEHGKGRIGVAFSCSIKHGEEIAAALRAVGARVECVSGEDTKERRDDVLNHLKWRELDVVVNCQLYGEGWDLPALDLCIMARPTASLTVYRQQVGRIMRPKPERPILLDHAGNLVRHGFVTELIEWTLDGKVKKPNQEAPFKTCPECGLCVPLAQRVCECGYVFRSMTENVETNDQLIRIDAPTADPDTYAHFLDRAWTQGYRIGWARHKLKIQAQDWPNKVLGRILSDELERKHYPCTEHVYEPKTAKNGYEYFSCHWCSRYRASDPAADSVRDRFTS